MQFYTDEECRTWMRGRALGEGDLPTMEESDQTNVEGKVGFAYRDAVRLSSIFESDSQVLMWVTETNVWHGNLHLYYRFRESYGDRRLVEDAPGHLFLFHEKWDLHSTMQIAIQNGWDFWVLGAENYARLFVSHDEWFMASVASEEQRQRLIP